MGLAWVGLNFNLGLIVIGWVAGSCLFRLGCLGLKLNGIGTICFWSTTFSPFSIAFPFSISRDSFHVWEIGLGIQANKNKVTMIARKRKRNPSEFGFASFHEYAWLIKKFSWFFCKSPLSYLFFSFLNIHLAYACIFFNFHFNLWQGPYIWVN